MDRWAVAVVSLCMKGCYICCHPRADWAACDPQNGKTKFTIENATKTRVVLADTKIHILGSYQVCRLYQSTSLCLHM